MFGTILFRMILWELTKVFTMALVGITGILLIAGIIAEATQQGLGPGQILAAIPLLIPSTLPYTIPATTLFATCVVYGRLASDNEILAIKAAGINIYHIVKPGMVLGIAVSLITLGLYFRTIPYTHLLLRAMIFHDAEELLYTILRKQGMISHSQMPYSMYVKGVQGRKLQSPHFFRRDARGQIDVVAVAREADLRVNIARRLLLIHMRWGDVRFADGSRGYFEDKVWEVPLPNNWGADSNRRARDMTWEEIIARRAEFQEENAETQSTIDELLEKARAAGIDPSTFPNPKRLVAEPPRSPGEADPIPANSPVDPRHIKNLRERILYNRFQILYLDVELLMRPALSFGCLGFILVGCPVGIWFSRSDYLSSFITCFLPIVLVYYPLMLCGTGMAKEGRLEPWPLVWGADILMASVGSFLFWRLCKN